MLPSVALAVVCVSILLAFALDSRRRPSTSFALWVPLIWTAIIASRPLGLWFNAAPMAFDANIEDGSAIDRTVLSVLIAAAGIILYNRRVRWGPWVRQNGWIVAFFVYCGLSVLWSDFPAIAFKRWVRAIGSVMMILVVLTEEDPIAAISTMMRRCAYVLVPISVVLIKYYRSSAVGYNMWTGEEYLVGVTTDKNALGRLCLLSGLFLFWELLTVTTKGDGVVGRLNRLAVLAVLATTVWLLLLSKSSTSLATFLVGSSSLLVLAAPIMRRNAQYLGSLFLIGVCVIAAITISSNLVETIVSMLGRDMTLTDRTFVWSDLLAMNTNPFIGVGYDSFWLGDRLDKFLRIHQVGEAHNGYLEVYLEVGGLGLILFGGIVLSAFFKAKRSLLDNPRYGRLRLAILAVFLLYNVTEAGYKPTTSIFFVLLLVTIEAPERLRQASAPLASSVSTPKSKLRVENALHTVSGARFDDRPHQDGRFGRRGQSAVPRIGKV